MPSMTRVEDCPNLAKPGKQVFAKVVQRMSCGRQHHACSSAVKQAEAELAF
jgi:hypothetical protein